MAQKSSLPELRNPAGGNIGNRECRALIGKPRILLFDEPTEGLSPPMVKGLMRVIREISSRGVAVLLAEQNVRMALATASRHYILDKGEIRAAMTTSEIENREDLLIAYLGVAARGPNRSNQIPLVASGTSQVTG